MNPLATRSRRPSAASAAVSLLLFLAAAPAAAQAPSLGMAFSPNPIGAGSVSSLRFDIDHSLGSAPASDVAFQVTLPAGLTVANPNRAASSCADAQLGAIPGGTSVAVSGARVGVGTTCDISVDVVGSAIGVHLTMSGDITSSLGNGGAASASLTVDADLPGFTKAFAPAAIPLGGTTTLSFTIDHTNGTTAAVGLGFLDTFDAGIVVATPANASTDCDGGGPTPTLLATSGATSVELQGGAVLSGNSCSVTVDVSSTSLGQVGNTTGLLASTVGSGGRASAVLDVSSEPLNLTGIFFGDPVAAGGTVDLTFTLTNFSRDFAATDITFSDDLDAALTGLMAVGLPQSDICGAGSQLTGTSVVILSGASLAPGASCSFSVTLQVPAGAANGVYTHSSNAVTGTVDGSAVVGSVATDSFAVSTGPQLTATFTSSPVVAGDTATLEVTLVNLDATAAATDVGFAGNLDALYPGIVPGVPLTDICGPGSSLSLNLSLPPSGTQYLQLSAASLPAGGSCTFLVPLTLPARMSGGVYTFEPGLLSATVAGAAITSLGAGDSLAVVTAPELRLAFVDGAALPGDTTTLEMTLSTGENSPADVSNVGFTIDLDAALPGLAATGLPQVDVCGAGSQVSGTDVLTFSAGQLQPNSSCVFNVTLQLPAAAAPGRHPVTSSDVSGTSLALAVASPAATQDLVVAGLTLQRTFVDDPVAPGGVVNIEYTLNNAHPTSVVTDITFSDDIDSAIAGGNALALPINDICGTGSSLSGASLVTFAGGSLGPASSCTFSAQVLVPVSAASGEYPSSSGPVTATVDSTLTVLPGAGDTLLIADPLMLSMAFTDGPGLPGGNVTLRFTVANGDSVYAASGISFSNNLSAALAGLTAVGLPADDVCGTGSRIAGTTLLSFTNGNLPAGTSCTFDVTLQLPPDIALGTVVNNVTSTVDALINGQPSSAVPASADLVIDAVLFTKRFEAASYAGGSATITFSISNPGAAFAVDSLAFADDLDAFLSGVTAVGLPLAAPCGGGSTLSGTSAVTLTGGSVAAGQACTFSVEVMIPAAAAIGNYLNVTSPVSAAGQHASGAASDTLVLDYPPPTFDMAFTPAAVVVFEESLLTFTIDNSASPDAVTDLAFVNTFPAGLRLASPPQAETTCGSADLAAVADGDTLSLTAATLAGASSCEVRARVTAGTFGTYDNVSGELTSSAGSSGTARATLTVAARPIAPPAGGSDGGCNCRSRTASPGAGLMLVALIGLSAARRRRRNGRV